MEHNDLDSFEKAWFSDVETCGPGIKHDPSEVIKRNASFLLESSKKIKGYDKHTLLHMQQFFDLGNYGKVIDLAYNHDRKHREATSKNFFIPTSSRFDRVKQFMANILSFL